MTEGLYLHVRMCECECVCESEGNRRAHIFALVMVWQKTFLLWSWCDKELLSSVCNTWTPVLGVKQSDISHITLAFYLLVNHPPPSHDANVIEPTCIGLPTDKIRLSHTTTKTHLHHFYHVLGDPATGLGELLGAHLWFMKVRRVCVCVCVCVWIRVRTWSKETSTCMHLYACVCVYTVCLLCVYVCVRTVCLCPGEGFLMRRQSQIQSQNVKARE